jgi:hypothetical protein
VPQLAKDGAVPLTIIRDGGKLNVKVPVSGGRPLLIPSLDNSYPSYFIYGPIVFSRATGEFLSFISSNAQALNGFSFVASPLVTRRGDQPDAKHEELVVISAPFFSHKILTGYGNRFGSVVHSINGIEVRSLAHLVQTLRAIKDPLIVIRFDQRGGENIVLSRQDMIDATESILSDNGIRLQGSPDMMAIWNK